MNYFQLQIRACVLSIVGKKYMHIKAAQENKIDIYYKREKAYGEKSHSRENQ